MMFSRDIRLDFPVLANNPELVYLDSASTSLVPRKSIDEMVSFLSALAVSSRRGAHKLAVEASVKVERIRESIASFTMTNQSQISFQPSLPCAIASLVYGYDWKGKKKNRILLSQNEEHDVYASLIRVAQVLNLNIDIIPMDEFGLINADSVAKMMSPETGIVAVGRVAPGTGNMNSIKEIQPIVEDFDAISLCDATRSMGFMEHSFPSIGADVVLCSGNIGLLGPPGLTLQWIGDRLGDEFIPGVTGGSAVSNVELVSFEPASKPDKFEPSILNIPAIAGLGASIDYIQRIGFDNIRHHLHQLSRHLNDSLNSLSSVTCYGDPDSDRTIFGFNIRSSTTEGIHCHDMALLLDESGIAVRSGLVCAHPSIRQVAPDGLLQVSLHFYNTIEDIDRLVDVLDKVSKELV